MKRGFIVVGLMSLAVLASAKTFLDKTNLDQLNYRVLESGQFAWTEEDGSAVLYVGSPTEVKNIRVVDPTALRGYRTKNINEELTFNAHELFTSTVSSNATKFTYTSSSADEAHKLIKYKDLDDVGSGEVVTGNNISKDFCWYVGLFINNGDGTYTPVTNLPDGSIVGGTNQTVKGVQYAYGYKYIPLRLDVITKDTAIEELDFVYTAIQGNPMGGDANPIVVDRRITYNGRHAIIEVDVTYTSGNGKWCTLSDFSARCKGIGDVEFVNDLTLNKIYIYDDLMNEEGVSRKRRPGDDELGPRGFDLSQLRKWAKHLYDGNRGVDWSKYPALNHLTMSNRWINSLGGKFAQGPMDNNHYTFAHKGVQYMTYENNEGAPLPQFEGVQVAFTDIKTHTETVTLKILIDVPAGKTRPAMDTFILQWKDDLLYPIWTPINGVWTQLDTDGLEWQIEVPGVYACAMNKMGFYRIYVNSNPLGNKLKITAEIQVIGSDGYMYKLSWPAGGGAVTATLVD